MEFSESTGRVLRITIRFLSPFETFLHADVGTIIRASNAIPSLSVVLKFFAIIIISISARHCLYFYM